MTDIMILGSTARPAAMNMTGATATPSLEAGSGEEAGSPFAAVLGAELEAPGADDDDDAPASDAGAGDALARAFAAAAAGAAALPVDPKAPGLPSLRGGGPGVDDATATVARSSPKALRDGASEPEWTGVRATEPAAEAAAPLGSAAAGTALGAPSMRGTSEAAPTRSSVGATGASRAVAPPGALAEPPVPAAPSSVAATSPAMSAPSAARSASAVSAAPSMSASAPAASAGSAAPSVVPVPAAPSALAARAGLAAPTAAPAPAPAAASAAQRGPRTLDPLDPPPDTFVETSPAPLTEVQAHALLAMPTRAAGAQPAPSVVVDLDRSPDKAAIPAPTVALAPPAQPPPAAGPGAPGSALPSGRARPPAPSNGARALAQVDRSGAAFVDGAPPLRAPAGIDGANANANASANANANANANASPGLVGEALRLSGASGEDASLAIDGVGAEVAWRAEGAAEAAAPRADGSLAVSSGALAGPDGALTVHHRPAVTASSAPAATAIELEGARERGRSAVVQAADHRVLRRGIHAEVDLGEAGRVFVHAENPGARLEVRLDADAGHTARALAQHAGELASELRTDARAATVTVSGPSTSASFSTGSGSGNGNPSSRREREERGEDAPAQPVRVGPGRRARFVL